MARIIRMISASVKPLLVLFGILTMVPLLFAADISLFPLIFSNEIEITSSSIPALRHWGLVVGGIGVLMVVAAFRPWLRYEVLIFAAAEKAFIFYLWLSAPDLPWAGGYRGPALLDFLILLWCLVCLLSGAVRSFLPAECGRTAAIE